MNKLLDAIRDSVKTVMRLIARAMNKLTRGKLSPNAVTIVGLLAHLPIAYLIAQQQFALAAILLVVFGLFDSLDGELARLHGKASSAGMLLDASTDRMKEVMLYAGVAFALIAQNKAYFAPWAVIAIGASLCVSYVKAKGETAMAKSNLTPNEVNRLFGDGLARFEVRMFLLIVGLVANRLDVIVVLVSLLSAYTACWRLIMIVRKLHHV